MATTAPIKTKSLHLTSISHKPHSKTSVWTQVIWYLIWICFLSNSIQLSFQVCSKCNFVYMWLHIKHMSVSSFFMNIYMCVDVTKRLIISVQHTNVHGWTKYLQMLVFIFLHRHSPVTILNVTIYLCFIWNGCCPA